MKAKVFLKEAGLQGATVQELIDKVQPGAAVFPTRNAMNSDSQIIAMPGDRFVYVDAFVDLDEAEEEMEKILNTHFAALAATAIISCCLVRLLTICRCS